MSRAAAIAAVAAIVAASAALATAWVFTVPLLQQPDEDSHLDYALALGQAGHLVRWDEKPLARAADEATSPFLQLLERRTDFDRVHHHQAVQMPAGYGTPAFFAEIDREARDLPPATKLPILVAIYPFGYYGLLAALMTTAGALAGPVGAVFAGRLLSVAVAAAGLAALYPLLRASGVAKPTALALTAATGLFPLTPFVASALQPDVLAFALVNLSLLLGFRVRESPTPFRAAVFGTALACLYLTKVQYFVVAAGAAGLMLVAELPWRVLARTAAAAVPPLLAAMAAQAWVVWGYRGEAIEARATLLRPGYQAFTDALHAGPVAFLGFTATQIGGSTLDYFCCGLVAISFWGDFGWLDTPLVFGSVGATVVLRVAIGIASLLVLGLVVVRAAVDGRRLAVLAIGGGRRAALRRLAGDPLVLSAVAFTALIYAIDIYTGRTLHPQGRYWMPVLPGVLLTAVRWAPAVVPWPRGRHLLSAGLLYGFLGYAVVAVPFSLYDLHVRYFG